MKEQKRKLQVKSFFHTCLQLLRSSVRVCVYILHTISIDCYYNTKHLIHTVLTFFGILRLCTLTLLSLLQKGRVMELCGDGRGKEKDAEKGAEAIDPLLQLITFFSRSSLTERRCVCSL